MFSDLNQLDSRRTVAADLCIVGAGAAGVAIASSFIGQSPRVCLVESGGFDFEPETQELYAGNSIGLQVATDVGRLRMFGGTTNHWGGRCAEFSPAEWVERPWIPYSGWPISLDLLSTYYQRAREICGFSRPWPSCEETLKSLGLKVPLETGGGVETQIWHNVPLDDLNFGVVYRRALERSKNVDVLLHANLTSLTTDPSARHVESINVQSLSGNTVTIVAKYFVLCTGAIENARLLLLPSKYSPSGLGNGHDLVGRFFMQHPRGIAATIVGTERLSPLQDFYTQLFGPDGIQYEIGVRLSEKMQQKTKVLNCSAVLQYEGDPESGVTAAQDIWRTLRDGKWADDLGTKVWRVISDLPALETNVRRWLRARRHPLLPLRKISVIVDLEQKPNPDSRVRLGTERDALGLPRVVVDWRASDLERETVRQCMLSLGVDLGARGLGRLRIEPAFEEPGSGWESTISETYHYIGTTRMAIDSSQGVVDGDCRVHGMDNLFIAGSSIFPTGGHVNPTLTIIALSLRLAEYLRNALQWAR